MKSAVLLVNLGTPRSPTPSDVGDYLREFLSDPRVVDLPRPLWLPLLNLVVVPLRKRRVAEAYRKIWLPDGSPLLVNSRRITDGLGMALDGVALVRLAMRYGEPSVSRVLQDLMSQGVSELVVLPLYPQFSLTTTQTVFDAVEDALFALAWEPRLCLVGDYHDHPGWVEAVASSIRDFQRAHGRPDKLIFSLHGIPQRYADAGDPYGEQCRASVRLIASALGLADTEYMLTFQSRVGREAWLQPYTDETLEALPATGCRHVHVVCPGFAADCLETLEEIAMLNRKVFLQAGGERYAYIPALNDGAAHIEVLAGLARAGCKADTDIPTQGPV